MSLPSGRSTVVFTFYAGEARSRPGSSSFTALALNKPSSSSSSSSSLGLHATRAITAIMLCDHSTDSQKFPKESITERRFARGSSRRLSSGSPKGGVKEKEFY